MLTLSQASRRGLETVFRLQVLPCLLSSSSSTSAFYHSKSSSFSSTSSPSLSSSSSLLIAPASSALRSPQSSWYVNLLGPRRGLAAPAAAAKKAPGGGAGGSKDTKKKAKPKKIAPPPTEEVRQAIKKFVDDRREYEKELSENRKVWQKEFQLRKEREEIRKAAEQKQTVLRRAIALREDRANALVKQEKQRQLRLQALAKYKAKLARTLSIESERREEQKKRYKALTANLKEESRAWITRDKIETHIVEDLFENPATTGIVDKRSELWRIIAHPTDPRSDAEVGGFNDDPSQLGLSQRLSNRGQVHVMKKMVVQEFLSQLIGNGKDRAEFDEWVEKFSTEFVDEDAEPLDDKTPFDYMERAMSKVGSATLADDDDYYDEDDESEFDTEAEGADSDDDDEDFDETDSVDSKDDVDDAASDDVVPAKKGKGKAPNKATK